MANNPTRFSGPVVYSGKGTDNDFFTNMPIGVNPDYVTFMDDFVTAAIDTDKWDADTLSSGTIALLGKSGDAGDDVNYGWAKASGNSTVADTGASLQLNENFQGVPASSIYLEARVGLLDADKSNLFVGFSLSGTMSTSLPFSSTNRIGFVVDTGSSEIKFHSQTLAEGGVSETTSTGISFEDYTLTGALVHKSRILGLRWVSGERITAPWGGTGVWNTEVHFYVDRKLMGVHKHMSDASDNSFTTALMSPWWAFTQGAGVGAVSDSVLDYMLVVNSRETRIQDMRERGSPVSGSMISVGGPR